MAPQETLIPKDPRRRFGDRGEDLARMFFVSRGFHVIDRNWSCRFGEIDLICEKSGIVHFVEVKTRRNRTFGYPEEALTKTKLQHIRRCIEMYMQRSPRPQMQYQIDVLAITLSAQRPPEFHYLENIPCE